MTLEDVHAKPAASLRSLLTCLLVVCVGLVACSQAPAGPPPDAVAVQRAYWDARLGPIEAYASEIDRLYPQKVYPEVGEGRNFPQAREKLAQARAALASAQAQTAAAPPPAETSAQIARLGRDRMERRHFQTVFLQHAADGETAIAQLWREETDRLDSATRVLDLLDQWRGHWRRDAHGFVFSRPDDTRAFTAAAWRINVAEIRAAELRARLAEMRARNVVPQERAVAP